MARYFATYFTDKRVWKSSDVVELGIYYTERAAMRAGLQNAREHPDWAPQSLQNLTWTRTPGGLVAKTPFGRYDIRGTG